jgi:hypothetical protein
MEHRWNEIDEGKPKYSGKTLSQYHFVHHKSHMEWPRDWTQASGVGIPEVSLKACETSGWIVDN